MACCFGEEVKEQVEILDFEGVGNLKKVQDELVEKVNANPFGAHNILADYIRKFKKMGKAGDKIMEEILALFKKSPDLKDKYNLVFRAFEKMSNEKSLQKVGF